MHDEINYLDKGNRKQVYWKDYSDLKEIDTNIVKAYLFEAREIDKNLKNRK